jgi:hypothetical protein
VNASSLLEGAADAVRLAATAARVSLDHDQVDRLLRLARSLDTEAEYRRNLELGFPRIYRRADAPAGATVGWYRRFCAITRQRRAELGLSPTLEVDERAA